MLVRVAGKFTLPLNMVQNCGISSGKQARSIKLYLSELEFMEPLHALKKDIASIPNAVGKGNA